MPEGDTVALDALRLGPALAGRRIQRARSRRFGRMPMLDGRRIVRLQCIGKNLVLHIDDGVAVRAHRRMTGRWSLESMAPRSLHGVDLALDVGDRWVMARDMPVLEVLRAGGVERHPALAALGPDLLGLTVGPSGAAPLPEPDWERVVQRARASAAASVAELLLDQRVACGLGNVYKSELLFLHGLHPFTTVGSVASERLLALYRDGRRLLIANTRPGRRTTRGSGRTGASWVYGRAGRPCLRCGTAVRFDAGSGSLPRTTEWCPSCQPARHAGGLPVR